MRQFSNSVSQFTRKAERRYRTIARTAANDTVNLAQRVRKRGGRMRVKTGFLRASIQGAINSKPQGPTRGNPNEKYQAQVAGEPVASTILRWNPLSADTLVIGWTANYARHREVQDGFLRGAAERWDRTVASAITRAGVTYD